MKAFQIAFAAAFLLVGVGAHAQKTNLPGGPDVKQWVGDPMIKEPTYDQRMRSRGTVRRDRGPTGGYLGGQPGEPQRAGTNGG